MSIAIDGIYEALDEKTRHILERRAEVSGTRRRGWLVRRALLTADLFGLTAAFTVAHLLYGREPAGHGAFSGPLEIVLFATSLPLWVVAAKIYGLYDRDDNRRLFRRLPSRHRLHVPSLRGVEADTLVRP
jgi:hypothetical protein